MNCEMVNKTKLEEVTPNIYAVTTTRGCNPGIVFTDEGAVFIDTAQWISTLMDMREFALKRGPIKYLINTEGHIDHIFGNHWFAGEAPVIAHENINRMFWTVAGDVPCYEYSVDVIERQDKEFLSMMPSKEEYIVNRPQITYKEHMTLNVGSTVFELYYTPGHCDAQTCVYLPGERVAFVGDTLFSDCQTWLHSASIKELLETLDFLEMLDVDYLIPGHGPIVGKSYINKQRTLIYEWLAAVGRCMNEGLDVDACIEQVSFADRDPVDIGQDEMMEYIQRYNVVCCYNYLKGIK